MPANKLPASQPALSGDGKRMRRARNLVNRYSRGTGILPAESIRFDRDVDRKRYERAVAVLVNSALLKS